MNQPTGTAMVAIDPRVRRQWRLEAAGATIVLWVVSFSGSLVLPLSWGVRLVLWGIVAVVIAVGLQAMVAVRYRYWKYGLGADVLILEHGVWTRRRSMTPYFRVQNVDVSQGPLERWLGLKRLTIRTASASTDASIPGLDAVAAEDLRVQILERAGRDAAV
jgi:membrane protein YdbS with pleckstrin-like domain